MRKRSFLMAAGICLAVTTLIAPQAAFADPVAPRTLSGVGSVTTQNVVGALNSPSFQQNISTLGSFDGTGSATIRTKNAGATDPCAALTRPTGSGAGIDLLIAQRAAAVAANRPSCVDFSRASDDLRTRAGVSGSGLTEVPFGVDGVTVATFAATGLPTNFTPATLKRLYDCDSTLPASVDTAYRLKIPQAGSGTRSFFLAQIGSTSTLQLKSGAPDNGTCTRAFAATAFDDNGNPLIENDARTLTDVRTLAPYSIADHKAQSSGVVIPDQTKTIKLRQISGQLPDAGNPAFPFRRLVYNIIPTQFATTGDPDYGSIFVGTGSTICTRSDIIANNGFGVIPSSGISITNAASTLTATGCGDTTTYTTGGSVVTARPSATVG